jgi:hypothetical protein
VGPITVWQFRKEKDFFSCHESKLVASSFVAMKNKLWGISTAWRQLCIHFITASGGYFHKTPEQSATCVQKEGLLRTTSLNYSVSQLLYWSESISVFFKVRPYTPLPRQRTNIVIIQHITLPRDSIKIFCNDYFWRWNSIRYAFDSCNEQNA